MTVLGGAPPVMAFRRLASIVLGITALNVTPTATAVVLGVIVALYLGAMFGLFYGLYNSALTFETRRSPGRQAIVGPLYGVMLWLVNFNVFARWRYPWLLDIPQGPQVVLHAVGYGLPLGLLYASAERRAVGTEHRYA